jgi:hypothetical protein
MTRYGGQRHFDRGKRSENMDKRYGVIQAACSDPEIGY